MDARVSSWVRWIDAEIDAAARAITEESGGSSVCRVHKDGRVTGGLKYEEGRLVALTEVKRLADHREDLAASLTRLVDRWAADLDERRSSAGSSMPWIAYATGGLEATEAAAAALRMPDIQ